MLGNPIQLTGTGYVVDLGDNTKIKSITLLGGSGASTVTLTEGILGAERFEIKAGIGIATHHFFGDEGFVCPSAYITLGGAGAKVTVVVV